MTPVKTRRILHVVTNLETGGAEHQLERVTRFARQQHSVVSLRERGIVGERIEAAGTPVHALRLDGLASWPKGLIQLRDRMRNFQPDIVQGWMYHGNLAAVAGAARPGIPIFWNVRHSVDDLKLEPWRTRSSIRASAVVAHVPHVIIYNSAVAAAQHESIGYPIVSRCVIPNGFDTNAFRRDPGKGSALRRRFYIPDDAPLAGVVARYHPMKDHIGFLESVKLAMREVPDMRIIFAGRGLDLHNRELCKAIERAGLLGRIHLVGECDDLVALYSALDVLCCVSAWGEAFPNVVGEAMLCETPCVVTDVGDASRIVGNTGITVKPRDRSGIGDAVVSLLNDSNLRHRCGVRARERIAEKYDLLEIADKYERVWDAG